MTTFERSMQFVAQLAESVVARLVVWDNVDSIPGSTRVLEEILARVNSRIHRRQQSRRCARQHRPHFITVRGSEYRRRQYWLQHRRYVFFVLFSLLTRNSCTGALNSIKFYTKSFLLLFCVHDTAAIADST